MTTIDQLLDATLHAARASQWSAYRQCFGALYQAFAEQADDELRMRLDLLSAAAPEHDPRGCLSELEELRGVLREKGMLDSGAGAPNPALDLRGLRPPEPMVRIFQALQRAPNEPLRVILPHEPAPLYALLRERGFSYSGSRRADGGYELLIQAV
jgi:TusA-related sulfurtransferase